MAPTDITAGTIPMSFVLNLLNGTPLDPAGQAELLSLIGTNLFGLQLDPRVSPELQRVVNRMLELGQPEAVFVSPVVSPL